jgi:CRP/FNR family cyclic AMP-dependent transcriptional regulator
MPETPKTEINVFKHSRESVTVDAGHVLFAEGDPGDVMYAVVEGEIDLTRGGELLEVITAGGIFGEMALIDPAPRGACATARTDARVVPVDDAHFTYLVHEHPTFALQVMRIMAERIRHGNERNEAARG